MANLGVRLKWFVVVVGDRLLLWRSRWLGCEPWKKKRGGETLCWWWWLVEEVLCGGCRRRKWRAAESMVELERVDGDGGRCG